MKLYHFNPNNYGEEAFVCANSLEEAKQALIKTKKEVPPEDPYDKFHNNERQQTRWDAEYHNKQIDEFIECKSPRTIDVFEPGEVIFSEIS